MWKIQRIPREPLEVRGWETIKEFPDWSYEEQGAVGNYFIIMANDDQLSSNYYYRMQWE